MSLIIVSEVIVEKRECPLRVDKRPLDHNPRLNKPTLSDRPETDVRDTNSQ
jgi:hypothetical protein